MRYRIHTLICEHESSHRSSSKVEYLVVDVGDSQPSLRVRLPIAHGGKDSPPPSSCISAHIELLTDRIGPDKDR